MSLYLHYDKIKWFRRTDFGCIVRLGAAFPKAIMEGLSKPIPPYNTILSAIRKLEKEGHIGYNVYSEIPWILPNTSQRRIL